MSKKKSKREIGAMMTQLVERCRTVFEKHAGSKMTVEEAYVMLAGTQPDVSKRAVGIAIRRVFPGVRRVHPGRTARSKRVPWFYYGLRMKPCTLPAPRPADQRHHAAPPKRKEQSRVKPRSELPQMPPSMLLSRDCLEINDKIGRGAFGICNKGIYRGIEVAVKTFLNPEARRPEQLRSEVFREASFLLRLRSHKNLPVLLGIVVSSEPLALVTKLCTVNDRVLTLVEAERHPPNRIQWLEVIGQIAEGLESIHRAGIIHNDIKDDNVVLDQQRDGRYLPVIIDFGKASLATCQRKKVLTAEDKESWKRNFAFIAPEVVDGISPPSESTDVYSLGYLMKRAAKRIPGPISLLSELAALSMAAQAKRPSLFYIRNTLRRKLNKMPV